MAMKVLICGGSGYIGSRLRTFLSKKDYQVSTVSRFPDKGTYTWTCMEQNKITEPYDVVVNLSGSNILGKWNTVQYSRFSAATLVNKWIKGVDVKPKLYIGASGVGIYPCGSRMIYSENDAVVSKHGFPSNLSGEQEFVYQWEQKCRFTSEKPDNTKRLSMRLGVVLGSNSNFVNSFMPLINLGLAFDVGEKLRFVPWVHVDDVLRTILFVIENKSMFVETNSFNVVSPSAFETTYQNVMEAFIKASGKSQLIYETPINTFISSISRVLASLILRKEANDIIFGSLRVSPKILQDKGFQFKYRTIKEAAHKIISE